MFEYYLGVAQKTIKPTPGQKTVAIGPSRRVRLFKRWNVKYSKTGRNVAFMSKQKVMDILFPSFVECMTARALLNIPDSLVGNTDQTPLQLCSDLNGRYFFEGIGNAGKRKLQGSRTSMTVLPVDYGGRMTGVLFIFPSSASSKKKGSEGYIFGDQISTQRIKDLKKQGVEQMDCHVVVVEKKERTVVAFVASNNGWHQGHNMPATCKFLAESKFLVCRVLYLPKKSVALLTADS